MQIPGTPTAIGTYIYPLNTPPAPSFAGWNMEPPTPGSLDNPDLGSALNEVFTPEMRERMVRLEKENQILRRRLAEAGDVSVEVGGGEGVVSAVGQRREERAQLARGRGGGEQTITILRKQLQEKEKRISQLEAVAKDTSKSPPSLPFMAPPPPLLPLLPLLPLPSSPSPSSPSPPPPPLLSQNLRTPVWRRCGGQKMLRLRNTRSTSTKPRKS